MVPVALGLVGFGIRRLPEAFAAGSTLASASARTGFGRSPVRSYPSSVASASFPWQPDEGSDIATIACLNFASDLHLYHAGFRDGAEALLETLERQQHGQDLLVYPLVYCLRHAVELGLKMVIRGARQLLDEPGDFPDGHYLHNLWNTARPLLEQIWKDDRDAYERVARVVESLRLVDPEGEGFRYPVTTRKKATAGLRVPTIDPTLRHLDLRKLYDDVSEVLNLLDGADTGIDVYAGYKAEMREEWASYEEDLAAEMRAEMAAEYQEDYRDEY